MFVEWRICICINGAGLGDKIKTNLALRWLGFLKHWEPGHTVLSHHTALWKRK
jgi:hypothetical protein